MEESVVLVSSSLFVFGNSVQKMCTSSLTYNNENKDSRSTSIAQIYLGLFLSIVKHTLKWHFKYISEKYIKPISEKYIKSKLKVHFTIFLFKRSILIAHLNKLYFVRAWSQHTKCEWKLRKMSWDYCTWLLFTWKVSKGEMVAHWFHCSFISVLFLAESGDLFCCLCCVVSILLLTIQRHSA